MIGSLSAASARLLLCCGAHARRVCKCFGMTTRHLTPPHMSSHEPTCRKACEGGGQYSPKRSHSSSAHASFRTSKTHSHMSNRFPGMGELDQRRYTHPVMVWRFFQLPGFRDHMCSGSVGFDIESEPSPTIQHRPCGITFSSTILLVWTHIYLSLTPTPPAKYSHVRGLRAKGSTGNARF